MKDSATTTTHKPRILIVDDHVSNILVIEELLADLDVELIRALSGTEAIEATVKHELALILMDVQMPGMDGFETVEIIRSDPRNELLPIIYITAIYNENYYRTKGIKSGAVDFLTKPIIPDLFIGKVSIFVDLYRQKKSLESEIALRNQAEMEARQARDVAEQAAKAKQQFLSTMSHEIRTPLNAIINTAKMLKEESPRPDQLENMDILLFSADNLLRLINDILDFSKIESGKIEFEAIDFELLKLINGIRQSFEYDASRKGILLETVVAEEVPAVIRGDSVRLSQILINLIGNAIKFTSRGTVSLTVELLEKKGHNVSLGFKVSDTGIGIPETKIGEIFESFTQASSSTTRKYGGTGLGLAITRKLVELQGGTIRVESKVNQGSTFTVDLTFQTGESAKLEKTVKSHTGFRPLNGLKVLVVEDNLVNQRIVTKYLSKWNAQVDLAENGLRAVEKVETNRYDVILMDLHMPEMSGYEATRTIREMQGEYYQKLPIIALTASVFMEEREKIYLFGMNGYVIKPFNPEDLYWKIAPYVK